MEQIFKELKKLGYKHYTEYTVEELDDLPLNSAERVSEQALVFRWFREKYELTSWIYNSHMDKFYYTILQNGKIVKSHNSTITYEEAELACVVKLIEIVKEKL